MNLFTIEDEFNAIIWEGAQFSSGQCVCRKLMTGEFWCFDSIEVVKNKIVKADDTLVLKEDAW